MWKNKIFDIPQPLLLSMDGHTGWSNDPTNFYPGNKSQVESTEKCRNAFLKFNVGSYSCSQQISIKICSRINETGH